MTSIRAAVVGARGYLGRETVRLLHGHPHVDVLPIGRHARGDAFGTHVPAMRHEGLTMGDLDDAHQADVLFLATPKGTAADQADAFLEAGGRTVIDLSRDHRIQALEGGAWHYGLADVAPPKQGTRRVANPGCYPTATLLATRPLVDAGLVADGPVIVDGKSGVSGAGITPSDATHYPRMDGSTRAYKVEGHDHTAEMQAGLSPPGTVRFTPHLVPQSRGLLATTYLPLADGVTQEHVDNVLEEAYQDAPFVRVDAEPDTAHVTGTNMADVAGHVDEAAGIIVCRGAIDNLVKGGAGQAVQNMNHCLGFDAQDGLAHTAVGI